jgi:hypothetical protein
VTTRNAVFEMSNLPTDEPSESLESSFLRALSALRLSELPSDGAVVGGDAVSQLSTGDALSRCLVEMMEKSERA